MDNTYKARAVAEDVKSELELRELGVVVLSFDADGAAILSINGPAAGVEGGLIRIAPVPTTARDVLGLQHGAFTPLVIQLCVEATANDIGYQTQLTSVCASRGSQVQLYETAAATVPSVAALIPANLKVTWHPNLLFPLMGEN